MATVKAAVVCEANAPWVLHTAPTHDSAIDSMQGLRPWAKIILMGISADDTFPVPVLAVTSHGYEIIGSADNGLEYFVEAREIVAGGQVWPMIQVFPKEDVGDACNRLIKGQLRFRAVVTY
ncbi:hypothetical protein [Streptomyces sp. NPDC006668]|uniref:hypothetical protein n=1 Tax=Streptomyces sp. NPDC006668 TaxID=3156903 RepID=UPI0033C347DD